MSVTAKKSRARKRATKAETVIAYKGFDKDLRCRGFQYEVGKTYTRDGTIEACANGFHACSHPLSVWTFYPVADGNRFALVEQSGAIDRGGIKQASRTIAIKAEIGIPELVKAAIEWTHAAASKPTSGDSANAATSGDRANAATSGNSANAATSGYFAHAATSGYSANAATSGYSAHAATSGNSAHAATSGNYAHAATSGDFAHAATSGYRAHAATSGDRANAATSGDRANAATSGYSTQAEASGDHAVAACAGSGMARAAEGGAIFLVERDIYLAIVAVFASRVGENGIKPNVWYTLKNGEPVEVQP